MSVWQAIGIAWCAMAAMMGGLWWVQYRRHNAGIVDVAWSFGTGLCALWFAAVADGDPTRRLITAVLAGVWAFRLGGMLFVRVSGEEEDGRYRMLREKWGPKTQPLMFGFFQIQAFWAVMFALPMLAAASNASPSPSLLDVLGIGVWLLGVTGESIADRQLQAFRSDPDNKGKVCSHGMWAWSRHPNYFFEWVHWGGYVLLAMGGPLVWLAVAGMLVMLLFLTKVTGIPLTEARSLLSRGDAYREYQRTTSPFIPLPPKEATHG
ncbi:MAG: DUF1295 domain-containing protein [Fimbriimonadaceae bacterium]|nr:DUF1295 domain-containing protein [Fimbriimonadaceae bacterium]